MTTASLPTLPSAFARAAGSLLAAAALAAPALASPVQDHLDFEMSTRAEDGVLRAAIEITIEDGFHIYGTEFSDDEAIGYPSTAVGAGDGLTWEPFVWPEPHLVKQFNDASIEEYTGTIVVYGTAAYTEESAVAGAKVTLDGQVCSGFCLKFEEELSSSGRGSDAVFANYRTAAQAAQEVRKDIAQDDDHAAVEFDWEPSFFGSDIEARLYVVTDDVTVEAHVQVAIAEGAHIFHGPDASDFGPEDAAGFPTTITFNENDIEWGPTIYPEPHDYVDVLGTTVKVHEGLVEFVVRGTLGPDGDPEAIVATVNGQICDENGCIFLDPEDMTLEAEDVEFVDALEPVATLEDVTEGSRDAGADGGAPVEEDEEKPLYLFLLEAVFWGFITLLMPCTYPMIPITISFFTKQASDRDGSVLPLSLAYGAGIVAIFVLIGVLVGPVIVEWAVNPIFNLFIALMFIVFSMSLFGWINLQPPAFLMNTANKASTTGGYLGVFLMGLTLVVTSFTCTAPFVGTLLARGAETAGEGSGNGLFRIVLGMGLFGITMATPFVFLSLFPSRVQKMPTAGAWMNTLKVFLGFVEIAASLKFLSNVDIAWDWEFLSKEVFLVLWGGIFLVAALFLFGKINLKGEEDGVIGPGRMVGGLMTFLFSVYCFFLIFGFKMDPLMVAFAPPYSSAQVSAVGGGGGGDGHASALYPLYSDDHETALAHARDKEKLVLINFTGVY